MNKIIPLVISLLLMFSACQDSVPDKLIDEDIYEAMFIEFVIIDQLDNNLLVDVTRDELREDVYRHYGVTAEEFRFTHQLFEDQIDDHLKRLERINRKLREEREAVSEAERIYRENKITTADSLRQNPLNR